MTTLPRSRLGTTGYEITVVGLGAWAIGGGGWQGGWGPQDDAFSIATIRHALSVGVNWIDTAPAYGLGHAEEVVGRALRGLSDADRPLVFTKCGLTWKEGETTVSNVLTPASIRRECEASLRRLGLESLDLLQVHWPSTDGTLIEEAWQTLTELVEEGKVRSLGASNFDVPLLERCQAIRQVDVYQPELNLIRRSAATDTIPWAAAQGTGVIVYSPMRSGLLSGAFSQARVARLPADDWRKGDPDFQEPKLGQNLALLELARAIAHDLGCTLPELAVAWTLAWPAVTGAIVGARFPDQVDEWVNAARLQLKADDLRRIAFVLDQTGAGAGPTMPTAPVVA